MESTVLPDPTFADVSKADARGVETIGGYRIIRRLGSGERSDVYLGHAGPTVGREAGLSAIKVFRPGASDTSINAEISALSRLQHAHIVGLLDLATGPRDEPCLVLQRLGPGGLPALLAGRRILQPGEAVTILAPLVAAVAAIHRNGVAHGGISARKVHFDDAGAPVIAGLGAAACFAAAGADVSEAALESESLVLGDRSALLKLVKSVVGRSAGSDESVELTRWLESRSEGRVSLAELEQRIFELAEPLAVLLAEPLDSRNDQDHPVPSRLLVAGGLADPKRQAHRNADASHSAPPLVTGRAADVLSVLPPDFASWISARLTVASDWVVSRATVLRDQLRSVRKGAWLIAAAGLTAVATAVAVAGPVGNGDAPASTPEIEAPPPVVSEVIAGDDPVAAVGELLGLRARCLDDRSILCLDSVHAADSAAWQADAERIRSVQDGGELSPDAFSPGSVATLVDRLGQTALVELAAEVGSPAHATASVLVIRTEAGWRFRSLVADSAPVDGVLP